MCAFGRFTKATRYALAESECSACIVRLSPSAKVDTITWEQDCAVKRDAQSEVELYDVPVQSRHIVLIRVTALLALEPQEKLFAKECAREGCA